MKLVKHLLDSKGNQFISISPEASVFEAIKIMADEAIGSVLVMQGSLLVGIITERDYARKVIIKGRSSENTRVSEIMTTEVITVSREHTIEECMTTMTERRIRHLPVVEDDRVIGVVSIGDLVQAIISSQKEEIEQLGQYISG